MCGDWVPQKAHVTGVSPTRRHQRELCVVTHNPKVAGSNPAPATKKPPGVTGGFCLFAWLPVCWGCQLRNQSATRRGRISPPANSVALT